MIWKNTSTNKARNKFQRQGLLFLKKHKISPEKDLKFSKDWGYPLTKLKSHLEKQFTKKMSWDNYRKYWVVDHIVPLSHFKRENILDAFKIKNLQPLEVQLNGRKANKILGKKSTIVKKMNKKISEFGISPILPLKKQITLLIEKAGILNITTVADLLNTSNITACKYLAILEAEGVIVSELRGNTKFYSKKGN